MKYRGGPKGFCPPPQKKIKDEATKQHLAKKLHSRVHKIKVIFIGFPQIWDIQIGLEKQEYGAPLENDWVFLTLVVKKKKR